MLNHYYQHCAVNYHPLKGVKMNIPELSNIALSIGLIAVLNMTLLVWLGIFSALFGFKRVDNILFMVLLGSLSYFVWVNL